MKKKILILCLFILLMTFTFCYTYFCRIITDDELYNFGFAYNITNNLVPYRDFNMIILPLFPYILSFFITIFGNHLYIYHLLLSFLIVMITFFSFNKVKFKTIALLCTILIYPYTGYNIFCLFLFMLLIYIKNKNIKHLELWEAFIISLMFLTKQTLGILIIPSILLTKNKKKVFIVYLITTLILLIYLYKLNIFYSFIDYCFLGMFDFASKNYSSNFLIIIELIFIILIIIKAIKSKKIEKSLNKHIIDLFKEV